MIWDDPAFRDEYRARLKHVQASGEAEVRAQGQAFQVESALAGGSSGDVFMRRAGAAAAATLSGYVRGALDAFDQTLAAAAAELDESALNGLRASLEKEIAQRAKSLPAVLREFTRPAAPPALLRAIVEQAPMKARELLRDRLSAAREQVRTHARQREVLDRAIFISHDARDVGLAEALKRAIAAAVGDDVPVCTSSDLACLRNGRDGSERLLAQLKKNRMTLSLITPQSIGDPSLWWTLGLAEGAGKPVLMLRTFPMSGEAAPPLPADRVFDLARREDVVRLLEAIQAELRRRPRDLADLDLHDVLRQIEGARALPPAAPDRS
jgi:hypothetical protein